MGGFKVNGWKKCCQFIRHVFSGRSNGWASSSHSHPPFLGAKVQGIGRYALTKNHKHRKERWVRWNSFAFANFMVQLNKKERLEPSLSEKNQVFTFFTGDKTLHHHFSNIWALKLIIEISFLACNIHRTCHLWSLFCFSTYARPQFARECNQRSGGCLE